MLKDLDVEWSTALSRLPVPSLKPVHHSVRRLGLQKQAFRRFDQVMSVAIPVPLASSNPTGSSDWRLRSSFPFAAAVGRTIQAKVPELICFDR